MRVTNITTKDPGQNILLNYNYEYDKMDNILTKATEHGDYVYDYDNLYRLINAESPIMDTETYTYDSVGNRLTSADTTSDWIYNQNNELETTDNKQYVYDANGNMISKVDDTGTTTYTYDVENRLVQISNPQSQISNYYYDPFGRRLWKDVSGTKTYFLYADEGLIGEYDGTGTEIKTYGYVPNSTWTTDPTFMKQNSQYYFYHNDHLGTPRKMTAINGAVVWSAKYSSFGEADVDITSTITNNLRFAGQYEDQETGLYYNWNRYYNSIIGRYLSPDPIGLESGVNNFYLFSENNPVINFDENGLECKSDSDCLKCMTYAESRGMGSTCYKAIAWTIKNRVNHSGFGSLSSICDIVSSNTPKKQYKAYNNCNWKRCCGDNDAKCPDTDPENKELKEVSDTLKDLGPDPTGGSDSFRSDGLAFLSNKWFIVTEKTVPGCDSFRFFKSQPKPKSSKTGTKK